MKPFREILKSFREMVEFCEYLYSHPSVEVFDKWGTDIKGYMETCWPLLANNVLADFAVRRYNDLESRSPIEQKLYIALWKEFINEFIESPKDNYLLVGKKMSEISAFLQSHGERKIYQPGDIDYEIDLFLFFGAKYSSPGPPLPFYYSFTVRLSLGIECDGHDYHEKTKEQAKKDKSKDRQLKSRGLEVIRFTGSEITKDPDKCAQEVHKVLVAQREKINEIIKQGSAKIIKFPERT